MPRAGDGGNGEEGPFSGFQLSHCVSMTERGKAVSVELSARHAGQALVVAEARRFNVLMCGRRWGKTALGVDLAVEGALDGLSVGWMAPSYKILAPAWDELVRTVSVLPGVVKNELQKIIRLRGGRVPTRTPC